MHIHTVPNIAKYDITDSLQIVFPAKVLNSCLSNDQIFISSQTLLDHLTPECILSFGNFENLYSNYESFIHDLVGHVFSNTPLFSSCTKFDKYAFHELLTSVNTEDNDALTGEIHILDVKKTLANLQEWNVFGNRHPTNTSSTTDFLPGDFFFMNDGFSITLNTDLSLQSMYLSFMDGVNTENRELWKNLSTKTYRTNLLIYLI
jgi:hypothetical protein